MPAPPSAADSPRDRFLTLYGRQPVLEALADDRVTVDKVLLDRGARGDSVESILSEAARRGLRVERVAPERVTRLSRNGRQDQGVVADVVAPRMSMLDTWLDDGPPVGPLAVVVLDGLTTPANVGMVIRTATAAGFDGIVVPRAGVAEVGPQVVKASAGVALRAPLLRCATASDGVERLVAAGVEVIGLRAGDATSLFAAELPERAAYVLGSESEGVSRPVGALVRRWVSIPLPGDVESLNVAVAGAILFYEVVRRRG